MKWLRADRPARSHQGTPGINARNGTRFRRDMPLFGNGGCIGAVIRQDAPEPRAKPQLACLLEILAPLLQLVIISYNESDEGVSHACNRWTVGVKPAQFRAFRACDATRKSHGYEDAHGDPRGPQRHGAPAARHFRLAMPLVTGHSRERFRLTPMIGRIIGEDEAILFGLRTPRFARRLHALSCRACRPKKNRPPTVFPGHSIFSEGFESNER